MRWFIDQACVDMIYQMSEDQRRDIVERIESRFGRASARIYGSTGHGQPGI